MICQSAVRWKNIFKTTVQTFSVTTMADALDIFMTQEYCLVSLIVAFFSDQTGKCQEESGQRDKYTSFKK